MLERDQSARIKAHEMLEHPWLAEHPVGYTINNNNNNNTTSSESSSSNRSNNNNNNTSNERDDTDADAATLTMMNNAAEQRRMSKRNSVNQAFTNTSKKQATPAQTRLQQRSGTNFNNIKADTPKKFKYSSASTNIGL